MFTSQQAASKDDTSVKTLLRVGADAMITSAQNETSIHFAAVAGC